LEVFRDPQEFKEDMGRLLDELVATEVADGCDRVYYAGLKEHEAEKESNRSGVPLTAKVVESLRKIAQESGVSFTL
jgi:LDH2 family malate/lactate/ureidoglycolate dehydrogenase